MTFLYRDIVEYFLVQPNDRLIHLPGCHFEEGKREIREIPQSGGKPIFTQGRKSPDMFVFKVPSGASLKPCLIVNENACVRIVNASITEIGHHEFMAAGVVEESFDAPDIENARKAISEALKCIVY